VKSFEMEPGRKRVASGRDGLAFLHVGIAVAFGEDDMAVFYDGNDGSGDILALELRGHHAVEEGFDVSAGEIVRGRVRSERRGS